MRVVVPVGVADPCSRLAPFLSPAERREFATAMCRDVLAALSDHEPTVVADEPVDLDAPVTVDDRPLGAAVDAAIEKGIPLTVVMADLPLLTPESAASLFAPEADLVFAPGRGGGTNAMVVRHPEFRTDYHGASIRDHRVAARELGASVAEVDSFRLATDVDERADLAEVLLHGEGRAADWLIAAGIELRERGGRVDVARRDDG